MRTLPFLAFPASPAPLALAVLLAIPQFALAQHAGHAAQPAVAPEAQAHDADAHRRHAAPATAGDAGHAAHAGHQAATPAAGAHDAHAGHAQGAQGGAAAAGHGGHAHGGTPPHADHAGHAAHADQSGPAIHAGHGGQDAGAHDAHAGHGAAPAQPRTPIPPLTAADIASGFPVLDHDAMEHAPPVTTMVLFDRLEAWDADHGTGQAWEATAWIGGDIHRLWLRSEGERSGGRTGSSDLEALYGRSVSPWWDVVAGVRHDFRPDSRTWAAFGVQGLAPYLFEVSATAYVGDGGQVQAKVEAEYDVRFTNRLILQPLVEATASLKDEPEAGIGSGLNKIEAGLRLRYEISRRFAPYVGLVHERAFGESADLAEAAGGHARDTRVVAGVRLWF
ncbi:copper resistance protein B [Luteimonas sp. Y-2-2-4F]|nr:copper resistance protein B [Luteimonas sp. Y-2-2-4F]MCD9032425.1 copper resistance protein B [Luteimonas sp. Y-2-2-4F]